MAGRGPGGAAAIHAARARKLRAELDAVDAALARAGFGGDEETALPERVAALCDELRALRVARDEAEWEAAGRGSADVHG